MRRRTFLGTLAAGTLLREVPPFRLGIAGLAHGHAVFLSRHRDRQDVTLVGIAEPNRDLATRYVRQLRLDPAVIHPSLDEMLDRARPQAVAAFTNISDHLAVV